MQEQLALAFRIASINFQRDSIAQVEKFGVVANLVRASFIPKGFKPLAGG